MRKKKGLISTIVLIVILLMGLSVALYPIISDWWNTRTQSRAIASYQEKTGSMSDDEHRSLIEKATDYNRRLAELAAPFSNYDKLEGYDDILNVTGTGVMGYITIPALRLELPIYHGTNASVLSVAVGHLQGSSFPVGGRNTHAVISAHRGLPSAKLFSDLDKLTKGDQFTITILGETLTYEVEETFIVLPDEMDKLEIIPGGDYVTLMTCTPYGVNSHRLLVRAKRVGTAEDIGAVKVYADAVMLDPMSVVPAVAAPIILILIITWLFGGRKKKPFAHSDPLSVFTNEDKKDGD